MGILTESDFVIAGFKFVASIAIAVLIVVVIRSELISGDFCGDARLGLTRWDFGALRIVQESNFRLFDATFGVWRMTEDFDGVFTSDISRVGAGEGEDDLAIGGKIAAVWEIDVFESPFEIGIA